MEYYSNQIGQLVEQLSSLPGIGAKTAQRLAFHIIDMPQERVEKLAETMVSARKTIRYCKECLTLTDQELCPICANPNRNHKVIMVVENPRDMSAYERRENMKVFQLCVSLNVGDDLAVGERSLNFPEAKFGAV